MHNNMVGRSKEVHPRTIHRRHQEHHLQDDLHGCHLQELQLQKQVETVEGENVLLVANEPGVMMTPMSASQQALGRDFFQQRNTSQTKHKPWHKLMLALKRLPRLLNNA